MSVSLLLQPGRIGSLSLDHRIMMGAMHLGIEGDREQLEQLKAFYVERALGGASLIITGGVAVLPEGGGEHMCSLSNDDHRSQLAEIARAVHDSHGKIAMQLFHSGRYARSSETGLPAAAPSAIPSRFTREPPKEMTCNDIARVQAAFVRGAEFAAESGFDAVEIMGSEGYLLNEFLSPLTNKRSDEYGGDLEGRMKLSLDIVTGIREHLGPGYPVIFRMSGDDCMEGSTNREETLEFAVRLEECGVDALNIGIGWHESRVPTVANVVPPGGFAYVAAAVRKRVHVPVIAANRIHTPEVAEELLAKDFLDFVAPARPWLADPAFAGKVVDYDRRGMNICVSCNQSCLDHTFGIPPLPVGCLVNPKTGHEREWRQRQSVRVPGRKVAVVGGGVAGLEAAKTAAELGHRVTLFEKESELGGQFRLASVVPGKQNFLETLRYYGEMLGRLGVTVELNSTPDVELLSRFDKVVLAVGVKPAMPDKIEGIRLPHVCTYADLLRGTVDIGRKVAVVGAGGIGCDVAHYLAQVAGCNGNGNASYGGNTSRGGPSMKPSITLISRSEKVAKGVGVTTRWVLLSELTRLGVAVVRGRECTSIESGGVWVEGTEGRSFIEADQVVICTGQTPEREWREKLEGRVACETVGGAFDARGINAARAIRQAYVAATRIS